MSASTTYPAWMGEIEGVLGLTPLGLSFQKRNQAQPRSSINWSWGTIEMTKSSPDSSEDAWLKLYLKIQEKTTSPQPVVTFDFFDHETLEQIRKDVGCRLKKAKTKAAAIAKHRRSCQERESAKRHSSSPSSKPSKTKEVLTDKDTSVPEETSKPSKTKEVLTDKDTIGTEETERAGSKALPVVVRLGVPEAQWADDLESGDHKDQPPKPDLGVNTGTLARDAAEQHPPVRKAIGCAAIIILVIEFLQMIGCLFLVVVPGFLDAEDVTVVRVAAVVGIVISFIAIRGVITFSPSLIRTSIVINAIALVGCLVGGLWASIPVLVILLSAHGIFYKTRVMPRRQGNY